VQAQRILVADPDLAGRLFVCRVLESADFVTATARTGEEAATALQFGALDLVLLDASLPDADGAACCRKIRETSDVPIVICGDADGPVSATAAFAAGADDFVTKPFEPELLLARIRAILRRTRQAGPVPTVRTMTRVQVGPLVVDHTAQRALFADSDLNLSVKELQVLFLLAQNVGKLVNRRYLQQAIWGDDVPEDSKTLDVHVSRLRKKLDEAGLAGDLIKTVRNRGYLLSSAVSEAVLST